MSKAIEDVVAERRRQVSEEGWTREHDDKWKGGELARAAACYAVIARKGWAPPLPAWWPWDVKHWKPKDQRRDLVRAAALLIAEIERIDRA